jgi:hypothetical protein
MYPFEINFLIQHKFLQIIQVLYVSIVYSFLWLSAILYTFLEWLYRFTLSLTMYE